MRPSASQYRMLGVIAALLVAFSSSAGAQSDSVVVVAGKRYAAGGLRRFFLGDTYRDLWTTPIRVPVIDLRAFGGGLKPLRAGGGNTTRSLRFVAGNGKEYVFRFVDKDKVPLPAGFEGTILETVGRDQVSANHPAGQVVMARLLDAAGVLHVTPSFGVLPDDPFLGEFQKEFASRLGTIEEYPGKPDDRPGFAGAVEVIESDSLRTLLDRAPGVRVATAVFLKARLMDMLVNDWDRHPGQWKWARLSPSPSAPWLPVPRDRDKVFISFGGIAAASSPVSANFVSFKPTYPGVKSLTWNSLEMDRRLLVGLPRWVFDSVAATLVERVTDAVIDDAFRAMPPEYLARSSHLVPMLRARRDSLPVVARRFYGYLAGVVDIHGTDSADVVTVTRLADGQVEVDLNSSAGSPFTRRRFDPEETGEIRIYLHGGDDSAVVRGPGESGIPVRVIGGNGTNALIDSSQVQGRRGAHLYDVGSVAGVFYGPDTIFNRRPWIREGPKLVAPKKDYGAMVSPIAGFSVDGDLGVTVKLGLQNHRYAFRHHPHNRWIYATGEYATRVEGFRLTTFLDKRSESSPLRVTARAMMSELEVTSFQGFGNNSPDVTREVAEVNQQQWSFSPAVAVAFGARSDISLGPVVQYNVTRDAPGRFVTTTRPYGSGQFGQAGLRLALHHDARDQSRDARRGYLIDVSGAWYPGIWDVASAFGSVSASAAVYYTFPIPLRPILVVRGGGKKLVGDFPFHESAFIGGRGSVRKLDRQRYAGDAAVAGTAELLIPVVKFPLILPIDLGIYGYADAGRVYRDGNSPGGWHRGAGIGMWVGVLSPATAVNLELGDRRGRTLVRVRSGLTF